MVVILLPAEIGVNSQGPLPPHYDVLLVDTGA